MSIAAALHEKAITLGKLSVQMTTRAGSGHPSSALSLADLCGPEKKTMYRPAEARPVGFPLSVRTVAPAWRNRDA